MPGGCVAGEGLGGEGRGGRRSRVGWPVLGGGWLPADGGEET